MNGMNPHLTNKGSNHSPSAFDITTYIGQGLSFTIDGQSGKSCLFVSKRWQCLWTIFFPFGLDRMHHQVS